MSSAIDQKIWGFVFVAVVMLTPSLSSPVIYHPKASLNMNTETLVDHAVMNYYSIRSSLNVAWDCDLCKIGVGLIQDIARQGKSWDEIAKGVTDLCIKLKEEDKTVCRDIIKEYRDEVLTVLDKLVLKPAEVCSFTFGRKCGNKYDPFAQWNVTLPDTPKPPVKPVPPPKKHAPTMRVLHLSDIHVDMHYIEGSETDCGEPICCRKNITGPVKEPAGRWGMLHNCDLPPRTLDNLFKHLSTNERFDYIVWTGDLPAHYVWLSSQADTSALIKYITRLFLKYFPNTPVYSTLGNHEGVPVNSFPPNWPLVPHNDSADWLYKSSAESWLNWIETDQLTTILKGGFYTSLVHPGLRIISLNMNLCNNQNWWLLLNMTDPLDQLQWFIQVLQRAEDKREKVQIIGHIAPGTTSCVKAWSANFYKIINRYESTIVGQFYGHAHHDDFEIFYDPATNYTRATSVAYIGPSVEAGHSGNSGYKVYTIDGNYTGTTSAVLDMEVHIFNVTEANLPGNEPVWYQEYSAKDAYNMTSLQPSEWDRLMHVMQRDDSVFQKFYTYFTKSHHYSDCDAACKESRLCAMRSARSYDPDLCGNLTSITYLEHLDRQLKENLC